MVGYNQVQKITYNLKITSKTRSYDDDQLKNRPKELIKLLKLKIIKNKLTRPCRVETDLVKI